MELKKKCYTAQQIHEAIDGVVNDYQKHMEIYRRLAQMEQEGEVVIRCKDCKYFTETAQSEKSTFSVGDCDLMEKTLVMNNGFCAWAIRRKNG